MMIDMESYPYLQMNGLFNVFLFMIAKSKIMPFPFKTGKIFSSLVTFSSFKS